MFLRAVDGGVQLDLYIQPGAKKSEISGQHGDSLKIRIHAPPVDGKANEEVCRFLSKFCGVSLSAVQIVRGEKSRHKSVVIAGISVEQAKKVLSVAKNDT